MSAARWGRWTKCVCAVFCLAPAAAIAQLTNDSVPLERTIPERERIESEALNSRYRLGPVRLLPRIALIGPTYNSGGSVEVEGEEQGSSWTAQASVGLAAVLPIGRKLYLRGEAYPEYIWSDREQGSQWGGTYGGGIHAFFNRLSLQADYRRSLSPTYPNSEIETQVFGTSQNAVGKVEINVTGKLSLFGGVEYLKSNFESLAPLPPTVDPFRFLDREESAVRGGLRFRVTSYFSFGVGYEETRAEFPEQPQRADNSSTAYLAGFHFDRPRLYASFQGGYRIGKARNGSEFPEFETFTGSGFLSYELAGPLSFDVYGRRGIAYGLFLDNPFYLETLGGVGANVQLGHRVSLRAFGEFGTNAYPVSVISEGDTIDRRDEVTAYGGGIRIYIIRTLSLTATARNTEYDSNVPAFSRSVLQVTSSIVLGGLFP